ncbi:hypothetical protein R4Y45_06915 [Holzapfeliella sp. He02]|uniref:Uncharacterized protein n=1 Tax=Holzapfeliella saturejae TaxID=3082953 RepID=A0ABU8SJ62_9LACO
MKKQLLDSFERFLKWQAKKGNVTVQGSKISSEEAVDKAMTELRKEFKA